MAQRLVPVPLLFFALLYFALLFGCSNDRIMGDRFNRPPETELTFAPLESDTTSFSVHLYWSGYDKDGEIVLFRYAIDADTMNSPAQWATTTAHDSIFVFPVDPISHVQGHVFWIIAQDNDGSFDPTPAKRFFTTRTLPPESHIVQGPVLGGVTGPATMYSWEGTDPDGGSNGAGSVVTAFEYILLRPETSASEGHPALPRFNPADYVRLINQSSGTSLPAPYDDWTWVSTTETSHHFSGLTPGYYVFAVRAVDEAGARETDLKQLTNIAWFTATASPLGPTLRITSNLFVVPLVSPAPIVDPNIPSQPIEFLTSQAVHFAWTAAPSYPGAPVVGYSFALEDTTGADWSEIDPDKTSITLPAGLSAGPHFLWIRAVDSEGGEEVALLRLAAVNPEFRQGPWQVLWVDDFTAPGGNPLGGIPNYPADTVDDDWWSRVLLAPLSQEFGVTYEQWDTFRHQGGLEGRGCPKLHDLARYRVVVWSVDLNNTTTTPTGIWRTAVGEISSDLANYVRGGGTVIITGFALAHNVTNPSGNAYAYFSSGMCAGLQPGSVGSVAYQLAYFTRTFMGIDGARSSDEGTRTNGARDFVEARVTSGGQGLGFESAEVDTGGTGTGAKWNPYAFPGMPDNSLAPGLPKIEGWRMQSSFACGQQGIRAENPGEPIAVPLFTYHGVNQGLNQDGAPSKREDLVVGIATQAHDLGESTPDYYGSPATPGDSRGMMGRMVFLGFPIYYMKDDQALAVMRAAFAYVNASPTLAPGP